MAVRATAVRAAKRRIRPQRRGLRIADASAGVASGFDTSQVIGYLNELLNLAVAASLFTFLLKLAEHTQGPSRHNA